MIRSEHWKTKKSKTETHRFCPNVAVAAPGARSTGDGEEYTRYRCS